MSRTVNNGDTIRLSSLGSDSLKSVMVAVGWSTPRASTKIKLVPGVLGVCTESDRHSNHISGSANLHTVTMIADVSERSRRDYPDRMVTSLTFNTIPSYIGRLVIYGGGNPGIKGAYLKVSARNRVELLRYELPDEIAALPGITLAELRRIDSDWELTIGGASFPRGGLLGAVQHFSQRAEA